MVGNPGFLLIGAPETKKYFEILTQTLEKRRSRQALSIFASNGQRSDFRKTIDFSENASNIRFNNQIHITPISIENIGAIRKSRMILFFFFRKRLFHRSHLISEIKLVILIVLKI